MEANKKPLMKHFAAVLRKRALSTVEINEAINPQILKFFTRKDLIQIIADKHDGTIPKQYNLVELENKELLTIIGDNMYIISYITKKWCEGGESPQTSKNNVPIVQKKPASNSQKGNSKAKPSTAVKAKK
ncbi:MAG: hypothetical protein PSN34_02990 [Urechidicola sp.]|nr:hypothetical protein [Urechidicola sp.]